MTAVPAQVTAIPAQTTAIPAQVTAIPADGDGWAQQSGSPPGPRPPSWDGHSRGTPPRDGTSRGTPWRGGTSRGRPRRVGGTANRRSGWLPRFLRPSPGRHWLRTALIVAVLLIGGPLTALAILVAMFQSGPLAPAAAPAGAGANAGAAAPGRVQPSARAGQDPAAIIAAVRPAVVDIDATLGFRNSRTAGTGVILDDSGLVLTNHRVIAGATEISVSIDSGRSTSQASVLGFDRTRDIALLRLANAAGLKPAAVGDSGLLKAGDPVIALGNSAGTESVIGTVADLDQSANPVRAGQAPLTGLIELSGAELRDNDTGGPLVDRTGRVVGITAAAGNQAFAIPINTAMGIARQIVAGNSSDTVRVGDNPFLGVETENSNGQGGGRAIPGAAVRGVVPGSPAQRAGISPGDVIVALGGRAVDSPAALTALMQNVDAGDQIDVAWVERNGQGRTAVVRLAAGPAG